VAPARVTIWRVAPARNDLGAWRPRVTVPYHPQNHQRNAFYGVHLRVRGT
jgi:hypothetical protein